LMNICMNFSFTCACFMSSLFHFPWFNHSGRIKWRVQIMKLFNVNFSPSLCYIYSQLSVLKHLLSILFPHSERHSSQPYKTTDKIIILMF
jgi:hypothetical protein